LRREERVMMNRGYRAGHGSGWGKGCRMGKARGHGARRPRYGRRSVLSSALGGLKKAEGIMNELRSINARIPRIEGTGVKPSLPGDMNSAKSSNAERRIPLLTAIVNKERCMCCGICVAVCPEHAISINDELMIDSDRCNGCGSCIKECPNEAISLSELRKAEAL
jgi:Pyruvate/2-oxoacid:ferredoxin oxidoreductase delta subunit